MDDVEHETEYTGDRAVNFQPAVQPPVTFTGLLYEEINDGKTVHKLLEDEKALKILMYIILFGCSECKIKCFHQFSKMIFGQKKKC